MEYTCTYFSRLGEMTLSAREDGLTGLWFVGQKYEKRGLGTAVEQSEHPVLKKAVLWLEDYFAGIHREIDFPLAMVGTPFQMEVWQCLLEIPLGETTTYGDIANTIAWRRGLPRMSAQAVGGAVGHNRISVIVPCHRVVGKDGSLTGYVGGLWRKQKLLSLEGKTDFGCPRTGEAEAGTADS